jgi:predicted permease
LVSTLLLGLVPAIQTGKIDLAGALKSEMSGVVGGGERKSWLRSGLVILQVSLSFLLLVGAGLLMQSLQRIRNLNPGFATHEVLFTAVDLRGAGYDIPRAKAFDDELVERVQALPGVESVALARSTPLSYGSYSSSPIAVDGYQATPDEQPTVQYNEVGPGYFATVGIPLLEGREFTRADNETGALVAIVNDVMAAQYWRGDDPVGKRLQVKGQWLQVVGVAKVSKYQSVRENPKPFFYVPLRQDFSVGASLNIRTRLPVDVLSLELAREVHALDANLAPYEVISLQEQLDRSTSAQRVAVTLLGILGGLALSLAIVGLYAVMSYTVSQSSREFGLRMALGAGAAALLRQVMTRGLILTATGVLLGTAAALGSTRLMGNLLFKVSPRDPLAFGFACVVMIVASLAACFLPAWRATRTDPARALRD